MTTIITITSASPAAATAATEVPTAAAAATGTMSRIGILPHLLLPPLHPPFKNIHYRSNIHCRCSMNSWCIETK
jgi:hypothetical protein